MTEFWLVLLGGVLSMAGGVVTSRLRDREAVRREDRAETRRVRQVIFALLCVRDEIRDLAAGLDFLPVLQSETPADEEELRQQLMSDRGVTIDRVVEQVERLLPGLSEVDPFAANLVKMNTDLLAKLIHQDYMSLADGPVYSAIRENERERLDDLITMIDSLLDYLAKEADLSRERIRRAVRSKEERIAALEEATGIKGVGRPSNADVG